MNANNEFKIFLPDQVGTIQPYQTWQNEKTETKLPDRIVIFDNCTDLINSFRTNMKMAGGDGSWSNEDQIERSKNDSWTYGTDFPSLIATDKALLDGDADKFLDRVAARRQELYDTIPRLQELSEIATTKRRRVSFVEEGDEVDIDRYMTNEDFQFIDTPKQDMKSNVARLYFNFGVSGSTSTDRLTKNVITMIAMCDILTMAGVSVEIIAGAVSKNTTDYVNSMNVCVMAKSANETLDVSRLLTFAIPGFYRYYMFGCWSNIRNTEETVSYGLGQCVNSLDELKQLVRYFEPDICINGANFNSPSEIQVAVNSIERFFNLTDKTDTDDTQF